MPEHRNFPDEIDIGAPFSNIVLDDCHAFLSGIVAADVEAGKAALGDIRAETEIVMKTIGLLLAKVGLGMSDIVRCDVHLSDLGEMDAMNEIYAGFLRRRQLSCTHHHPKRSSVRRLKGGSNLYGPAQKIEFKRAVRR